MDLKRKPYQRVPQTSARASLETRQIVEMGAACAYGDLLTYAAVLDQVGIDLQERRDLWATASRILLEVHGMVFAPVNGLGYVRLSEPEKLGWGEVQSRRVARRAEKNIAIVASADPSQLSTIDQHRRYTLLTRNALAMLNTSETALASPSPVSLPMDASLRDAYASLSAKWR